MKKVYEKRSMSGRSMIEMLGVLAIIGVLSAGGIAGYSMAMNAYKTNEVASRVQTMSTQVRVLYQGKYDFDKADSSSAPLAQLGYATDFRNPFGGANIAAEGERANGQFKITVADVPQDACVKYLTTVWADSSMFNGLNVGATTGSPAGGKLDISAAMNICTAGSTNDMIWYFK